MVAVHSLRNEDFGRQGSKLACEGGPDAPMAPAAAPAVSAGRVVYALGDIRGRLDLVQQLLDLIAGGVAAHPADSSR